ncbi:plasmid transfer protein TraA [Streptomyces sp. NPDC088090]|uniref:plasmid transfer protein TraA n=1 Tax=Streptomyces sp. NPDC088090 TaxID=3365822 RepID=UPI00384CEE0B
MATRNGNVPPQGQGQQGQGRGRSPHANKFANAGAVAGGFVGAMGGSFVPPINLTVNTGRGSGGAAGASRTPHFMLGEPQFASTEDVRNYCNGVRALMIQCAIELAMGAKILEARLAQAQTLPDDTPIHARLRAAKVGRKLKRAADGATAAAKNAVAAYAIFQREYADLMRPRPKQRPAQPQTPFQF